MLHENKQTNIKPPWQLDWLNPLFGRLIWQHWHLVTSWGNCRWWDVAQLFKRAAHTWRFGPAWRNISAGYLPSDVSSEWALAHTREWRQSKNSQAKTRREDVISTSQKQKETHMSNSLKLYNSLFVYFSHSGRTSRCWKKQVRCYKLLSWKIALLYFFLYVSKEQAISGSLQMNIWILIVAARCHFIIWWFSIQCSSFHLGRIWALS